VCPLWGVGKPIAIRPKVATKSTLNCVLYYIPREEGKKKSLLIIFIHLLSLTQKMKTTTTMYSKTKLWIEVKRCNCLSHKHLLSPKLHTALDLENLNKLDTSTVLTCIFLISPLCFLFVHA
jgi:hypothetical protein